MFYNPTQVQMRGPASYVQGNIAATAANWRPSENDFSRAAAALGQQRIAAGAATFDAMTEGMTSAQQIGASLAANFASNLQAAGTSAANRVANSYNTAAANQIGYNANQAALELRDKSLQYAKNVNKQQRKDAGIGSIIAGAAGIADYFINPVTKPDTSMFDQFRMPTPPTYGTPPTRQQTPQGQTPQGQTPQGQTPQGQQTTYGNFNADDLLDSQNYWQTITRLPFGQSPLSLTA